MGCGGSKIKKEPEPSNVGNTENNKSSVEPDHSEPKVSKKVEKVKDNGNTQKNNNNENSNEGTSDDEKDTFESKYILKEEIGRGGFSIVYKAIRKSTQAPYAVKIIEKSLLQEDIKLLRREIEIMKKVDHENVLKLHKIYEDSSKVFIIMELVEGSELFDRIVDKGYYSEKNAINIVQQILSAVSYLHKIGIAHRDLKPENLLCSGDDENEIVKIADFGLSKIFNDEEELMTSCGTPGYVAPEVLMCESYDKSVDMWGIGIITYILLAGYPPFYAENDTALFEKIMNAEYDFDDECWEDVSDLAKDFIRHLLVKDPKDRYTAEQAMEHPWLKSNASDKQLKIGRKLSEYNIKRKEDKARFVSNKEESIANLNKIRASNKKE